MVVNMVDRTEDFKKAVREARKGNMIENSDHSKLLHPLSRKKQWTEFNRNAQEIVRSITKLRDFLLQHRNVYINANQVLGLPSEPMTDYERDKIDEEAQSIIRKCNEAIATMRQNMHEKGQPEQVLSHRQLVLTIIQNHLKSVCKIYSEQRAIRVKLVVDKKRISRLHNPETHKKSLLPPKLDNGDVSTERVRNPPPKVQNRYAYEESDDEISEEEAAALEQENALLFNDMNSMVDEVKAIEGKVVEITRLQEVFSEQVLQQEGEIEMISEKVVESTENIKAGNEELREAIKNNAGFRVWILFFLVMCSFSLLFLEWYS